MFVAIEWNANDRKLNPHQQWKYAASQWASAKTVTPLKKKNAYFRIWWYACESFLIPGARLPVVHKDCSSKQIKQIPTVKCISTATLFNV